MEHCFECGTDYGYLGTTPHDGSCPACGSSAVTPAGDLTVTNTATWESANGLSKVRVTATDDGSRCFEFVIAARRAEGKLVRLVIDGATVPTETVCSVPSAVGTEVSAHGIRMSGSISTQSA